MSKQPDQHSRSPSVVSSRSGSPQPELQPQQQHEDRGRSRNARDLSSSSEDFDDTFQRSNRRRSGKNRQNNQGLGIPGLDDISASTQQVGRVGETVGDVASGVGNVASGVTGGGKRDNEDTLKLRLDLNLDVAVELKARVHGDVTLSLL